MSQSVSTLAPLDEDHREAVTPAGAGADHANPDREGTGCTCTKCGLYRWYPPLMMLSTVLAGVFCWMYVTKPVFLAQPREAGPAEAQPAFQEGDPTDASELSEPPTAESGGRLDPTIATLPGESKGPLQGDLISNGVLSGGLKPLRVERAGPPLFQPSASKIPSGTLIKKEPIVVVIPQKDQEQASDPGESAGEKSPVTIVEGTPASSASEQSSEGEDYRPQASFMAEFAATPKPAVSAKAAEDAPID